MTKDLDALIERAEEWESSPIVGELLDALTALREENERLNARLTEMENECFKLSAGVCEYRSGDDHGNPLCLMIGKRIPPNMTTIRTLKGEA